MIILPTIALSVRQPWAWAIIHGGKNIENRSRFAITKGAMEPREICIHAGKGMTQDEYDYASRFMAGLDVTCPRPDELVRGAIIGKVMVTGVVMTSNSPWFFGPRGLVLMDATALDAPIAGAGALGYFKWGDKADHFGEPASPLPWMKAWPDTSRRKAKAAPLFEREAAR